MRLKNLLLSFLFLLMTGCAASLVPGWEKPVEVYRGRGQNPLPPWKIHVTNWWRVQKECGIGWLLIGGFFGCTDETTREIWAINNPAVLWHECGHVKNLDDGGSVWKEWAQDLTYGWAIGNVLIAATLPLPASEKPCGVDYFSNSKWIKLPTAEEVKNGTVVPFGKQ